MDEYLHSFREMISLRGLTDHTHKLLYLHTDLSGLSFGISSQISGRCFLG